MLKDGDPRSLDVDCEGDRCPRKNIVVGPELVGFGDEVVGLLGEAPYEDEVKYGRPFIGRSGMVLRKYLDLQKYKYVIFNSIQCLSRKEYDIAVKPSDMGTREVSERLSNCTSIREAMLSLLPDEGTLMLLGNYARRAIFFDYVKYKPSTEPYGILHAGKFISVYVNYHPAYTIYRGSKITDFEEILRASGKFKLE